MIYTSSNIAKLGEFVSLLENYFTSDQVSVFYM